MATAEARAAALALPSAVTAADGPIASAPAPATPAASPAGEPAAALASTTPAPAVAEPAKPPADPDAPRTTTFEDWQSLKHQRAKMKDREAKAATAIAEAEQAKKEALASKDHPAVKAWGQKGDVAAVVKGYAEHHGITYTQALEILSHQTMNDGALPQDAALKAALDPVQAKLAELEEKEKKLVADIANREQAAQKMGMSQGFVNWATAPDQVTKYPVLSAESPADIAESSWVIANQMREEMAERAGVPVKDAPWPNRDQVAAELEKLARGFYASKVTVFERYKSATAQAVNPATDTGTPNKPEGTRDPASPGSGASSPRTLSNRSASERAAQAKPLTREQRRTEAMKFLR